MEGLAGPGGLHPLQAAFIEHDAVQCGICIPGMLMSLKALLDETLTPSEDDIRQAIAGNLCRCGTYPNTVKAALAAARALRAREEAQRDERDEPAAARPRRRPAVRSGTTSRWSGRSIDRRDAVEKVTGQAVYSSDMSLPGMLHAKVLRCPHAHARIRRHRHVAGGGAAGRPRGDQRRTTRAGWHTYWYMIAQPAFPTEIAYAGQEVAAVAADSVDIALRGAPSSSTWTTRCCPRRSRRARR